MVTEKKQVEVYREAGGKPWLAVVLVEGPCQSLVRWVEADAELVGREACVPNRFLRVPRAKR